MGATAIRRTGTALISAASAAGVSSDSCCDEETDASRSNPIATGESFAVLRRNVASDCLPRAAPRRRSRSARLLSGRKSICSIASPQAPIASRSGADSA